MKNIEARRGDRALEYEPPYGERKYVEKKGTNVNCVFDGSWYQKPVVLKRRRRNCARRVAITEPVKC